MHHVVVIGAGHIGSTIASLLSETGDYTVTVADRSVGQLSAVDGLPQVDRALVDVTDGPALRASAGRQVRRCSSAAPYPP